MRLKTGLDYLMEMEIKELNEIVKEVLDIG